VTDFENLAGVEALASCLGDPDCCFVDCRFDLMDPVAGYDDYLEGHIPGAVYANLNEDLAGPALSDTGRHPLPDIDELSAKFGQFGIGSNTKVAVYDAGSGAIAARAWWLLRWLGHRHVALLDGGFNRWQREGLPIENGPVSREPRRFAPLIRSNAIIDTAELMDSIESVQNMRIVDARVVARFRGQVEPIDPVAGHIPGALNLPFADCLSDGGTWKPAGELRRILAQVLGDDLEAPWGVMCGSGVTACHLAISGRLAGYRDPRLYVGSWSEWIRDPRRPIATEPG